MRDRRFGVELEFDSNGLGREGVVRVLRDAFDRNGFRRWNFTQRTYWDGSELELCTPPLRGEDGFKKLKLVMQTLENHGCFTTEDDGLHVHHDAPEFTHNIDNCIRLVKSWRANSHLIYQFVVPYRTETGYGTGDYWACPKWSNEQLREMERLREVPYWDRNDLNLGALEKHGTIEIRLHEGTLDYDEAESWILFGQRFIDRVLKHSMRNSESASKLLKKVRVNPNAEKLLLDKARYMRGASAVA